MAIILHRVLLHKQERCSQIEASPGEDASVSRDWNMGSTWRDEGTGLVQLQKWPAGALLFLRGYGEVGDEALLGATKGK